MAPKQASVTSAWNTNSRWVKLPQSVRLLPASPTIIGPIPRLSEQYFLNVCGLAGWQFSGQAKHRYGGKNRIYACTSRRSPPIIWIATESKSGPDFSGPALMSAATQLVILGSEGNSSVYFAGLCRADGRESPPALTGGW